MEDRNQEQTLMQQKTERMPSRRPQHGTARVQSARRLREPTAANSAARRLQTARVPIFEIKKEAEQAELIKPGPTEDTKPKAEQPPKPVQKQEASVAEPVRKPEPPLSDPEATAKTPEKKTDETFRKTETTGKESGKKENVPSGKEEASGKKRGKYGLWISAGAIFLAVLIVAVIAAAVPPQVKEPDTSHFMDQIRTQEVKINDVAAIDSFFSNYYTALSSGNTTAVELLYDDPSKAHVTTEIASIVSQYDNLKIYVTPGIEKQDVVAFVYNEIHFANISATAPSVDSFYLRYSEEEAAFKICSGMYSDPAMMKFMNLVSYREPIRSLLSETNDRLSEVLADDKDLNNLFILMQSMTEAALQQKTETQESEAESLPVTEE